MGFQSPRFAGDRVLEEIFNDPDTGTKKLEPGSPPESVRKVQQALFDLNWTLTLEPPVTDPSEFVIGIYGPKTQATVLNFRRHYDIHWPPSAPTGTYSGTTGPRTLQRLDVLCVAFDESVAAINSKATQLQATGLSVEWANDSPPYHPIPATWGTFRAARIASADGAIIHHRDSGAHEVHGRIYRVYADEHGFASGPLGFPISDERDAGAGFRRSDFQHGSLRCNLSTGVVELISAPSASATG